MEFKTNSRVYFLSFSILHSFAENSIEGALFVSFYFWIYKTKIHETSWDKKNYTVSILAGSKFCTGGHEPKIL